MIARSEICTGPVSTPSCSQASRSPIRRANESAWPSDAAAPTAADPDCGAPCAGEASGQGPAGGPATGCLGMSLSHRSWFPGTNTTLCAAKHGVHVIPSAMRGWLHRILS